VTSLTATARPLSAGPVTCSTISNGVAFSKTAATDASARLAVVTACRDDGRTNVTDCDVYVTCQGTERLVTCSTINYGMVFSKTERSEREARRSVALLCKKTPGTSKAECTTNIHCEPQLEHRSQICHTYSRDYHFTGSGAGEVHTRETIIRDCQDSPFTDRIECVTHAACYKL
jgi:hypothetical protein